MRGSIKENRRLWITLYTVLAIAAYAAIALVIMHLVSKNGIYPGGTDTMYHIYRGELVYNGIGSGNWYPLYDANWYNGVEIMRYWAPLCPYFYALCMAIAKPFITQALGGYIVFTGMVFFLGAVVWHIIGIIMKRPFVGSMMAVLWFFIPANLFTLFGEGDLSRSVAMIFLPLLVFAIYNYLNTQQLRYLPVITVSFMLVALCHLGYAGMVMISLVLYLIMDMVSFKRYLFDMRILVSAFLGITLTGFWTLPGLIGGVQTSTSVESIKRYFQNLLISINPFHRIGDGLDSFYFGLALALIAFFGAFLSYKKSRPGFWLGLITLVLSTETLYNVVFLVPGKEYLLMLRFFSIAICFVLMSLMEWRTLRKPIFAVMMVLLVLDVIPSLRYIYGRANNEQPDDRNRQFAEETLVDRAKKITKQRLCVLEEGALSDLGAYIIATGEDAVMTTFGAEWEAAEINKNIVNLNKGLSGGGYIYTFDRAMELGSDTVLLCLTPDEVEHTEEIDEAANRVGYRLDKDQGPYRLYSLTKKHPDKWGVVSNYRAIGIGGGSEIIARQFPYVKEGGSDLLDDYTFEELKDYELLFLNAFEFKDREYAENLIVKLSEAGVKVIISADGVPEDRTVNGRIFLGVVCNPISFSQGFPLLETIEGELDTDLFPPDNREWSTFFCDGLDQVWGKVKDESYDIPFLGKVKNDNIIYIGLNLTYYYGLTKDASVEKLLGKIMSLSPNDIPSRELVPLDIDYRPGKITIKSDYDKVNTTLAYHNMFNLDKTVYEDNHQLYVPKGTTEIRLTYPQIAPAIICTLLSLIFVIIYHLMIYFRELQKRAEQERKEILTELERQRTLERRRTLARRRKKENSKTQSDPEKRERREKQKKRKKEEKQIKQDKLKATKEGGQ